MGADVCNLALLGCSAIRLDHDWSTSASSSWARYSHLISVLKELYAKTSESWNRRRPAAIRLANWYDHGWSPSGSHSSFLTVPQSFNLPDLSKDEQFQRLVTLCEEKSYVPRFYMTAPLFCSCISSPFRLLHQWIQYSGNNSHSSGWTTQLPPALGRRKLQSFTTPWMKTFPHVPV